MPESRDDPTPQSGLDSPWKQRRGLRDDVEVAGRAGSGAERVADDGRRQLGVTGWERKAMRTVALAIPLCLIGLLVTALGVPVVVVAVVILVVVAIIAFS